MDVFGQVSESGSSLSSQISMPSMLFGGCFSLYHASSRKSKSLHLLPFLGDNNPVLPAVQYLKTVVSYNLSNILIAYIGACLEPVILSWLEVEVPHYYYFLNY